MLRVRYLQPEPIFSCRDLSIRGIGIREVMPPSFISRPSTGDHLLMVFHDSVEFGAPPSQKLPAGSMVIWRPGDSHHYGQRRSRWSHSWIHCTGSLVARALAKTDIPRAAPFALADPAQIDQHLLNLHKELTAADPHDVTILRYTLVILIREAARSAAGQGWRLPPPANFVRVRQVIDARYAEPLSLRHLADLAGLSVPHFCTEFGKYFGVAPITYLVQRRMSVAAALLRESADTVANIARHVGYPDQSHFCKVFKSHVGVPPTRLRARLQGKA